MKLYSERHGMRAPLEKTYSINKDMYLLLLNCCTKYLKNLIHLFILNSYDDFTASDYIAFNEEEFKAKIKVRIPTLYRDEFNRICVPSEGDEYDQYALLDYIEFFAQNIKDISEKWNNDRYKNYQIIECFESSKTFKDFQDEINQLLTESGLLYQLTDEKIIERVVENNVLTMEIENRVEGLAEIGVKELLKDSISLYKTPHPAARQDSVEKIWDALERLKSYYEGLEKKKSVERIVFDMAKGDDNFIKMFDDEFRSLTKIGNDYRIRHHETNKIDIIDTRYYDYLFNRCLSLIAIAMQYLS